MKIDLKEKAVALQKKTTAIHFPGSVYSLEGCPPAEPSSALTDDAKFTHINLFNKLIYQHVNQKVSKFCQPKS